MKMTDASELTTDELMSLKVGDVVWFCPLLFKSTYCKDDLLQGTIHNIFRRTDRRQQIIALDLIKSTGDITGFIIGCYQVPVGNVFKPK